MCWALGASMESIAIAHFILELPSFTSSMLTFLSTCFHDALNSETTPKKHILAMNMRMHY